MIIFSYTVVISEAHNFLSDGKEFACENEGENAENPSKKTKI